MPLSRRSILEHALDAVTEPLGFGVVVIVVPSDASGFERLPDLRGELAARIGADVRLTAGGASRAASVAEGVHQVEEHARSQGWDPERTAVLIHDAARALTPSDVYRRVTHAVEAGAAAAVPGLPVADTIKQIRPSDGQGEESVEATPPRARLRAVQTPQGFSLEVLQRIRKDLADLDDRQAEQITDEGMAAEHLGHRVVVVPGDERGLKITTPTDLVTARGLLGETGASGPHVPSVVPRIGVAHDIHAFASPDEPCSLMLGGLEWPRERGLAGHSDGDAAAHAACAALFSAAGMGDLGTHFGADTIGTARADMEGASGVRLLEQAADLVRGSGYAIGNISIQLVANRPKFAPRREESEAALTRAAQAPVSVAATTSDGLGFTGRGEGIMATATALIYAAS